MVFHDPNSLSQNFIKYPDLVSQLVRASNINDSDTVIEIGPGHGIITRALLRQSKQVIAIEIDPILASKLIESHKNITNLKVLCQDFLTYPLPSFPYKVFSNIPFSLTSKIINKFLTAPTIPTSMYLILQQEVAEKFMGHPETKSSLLAKPWYEIKILGGIDRTSFTKKPQVRIVLAEFKKRPLAFIKDEHQKEYRRFINYGFHQWQPTFLEAYKKVFTYPQLKNIEKTFKLTGLKPSQVSFDSWLHIFKIYLRLNRPSLL